MKPLSRCPLHFIPGMSRTPAPSASPDVVRVMLRKPAREVDTVQNNTAIHAAPINAVGTPNNLRNKK